MKPYIYFTLFWFFFATGNVHAQDLPAYEKRVFIKGNDTLPYRLLYPENFDSSGSYPLVIFLHGSGESGHDNVIQLVHGGELFLQENNRRHYPAFVLFPQCPDDSYWANVKDSPGANGKLGFEFRTGGKPTKALQALMELADDFLKEPYINTLQIYLGGLSMGGIGTYELLRRRPHVFAAAFVVCGADNVKNVKKYKHIPLWIFHGQKDDIVPVSMAMAVVRKLEAYGATPKFSFYPEANHNSWDPAFAEAGLLPWLFEQHK